MSTTRRVRPVNIGPSDTVIRHGSDGVVYLRSPYPLGDYPVRITDHLEHWATHAPDRVFLAQRESPVVSGFSRPEAIVEADFSRPEAIVGADFSRPNTPWRTITYAETLRRVRRLAQGLLDRGLSVERPVMILSGNGIDHALLALASMYAGVPYAPIAPAYSLQAKDFATLRVLFERLKPGLVFAAEGAPFERALATELPAGTELAVSDATSMRMAATRFGDLEREPTPAVDAARDRVGPDTIAKVLFTSGSTGRPKGVINTQRMLCSNQAMMTSLLRFLADEPPIICDWSPWNHTAGGNHNFGLVLTHGGTLYIDEGKPTPALFHVTLQNLREVACTAHFAVPRLYEMLMPHLRSDAALRETFFSRLRLLFYAAAGLGQRFWDELREVSLETCGEEIVIMTGFGCTETAPFMMCTGPEGAFAGLVGLPAPGQDVKLVPAGEKIEARVKGPNVTPGYWADEALTQASFDEEGFYKIGDAMHFADPANPQRGLIFDGRLAEDFKLSTGTWVSVGPLRARILAQAAGLAQDVVITGHDREFVGALVFPNIAACRQIAGAPDDAPAADVLRHPDVVARFREAFAALARKNTGSSTFVARALLLDQPPSLDAREITDKGSLNQKAVIASRAALVDELYSTSPTPRVISVQ